MFVEKSTISKELGSGLGRVSQDADRCLPRDEGNVGKADEADEDHYLFVATGKRDKEKDGLCDAARASDVEAKLDGTV